MGFVPKPGEVVVVDELPECNFDCERPGIYDFVSQGGQWGNACERHYHLHRRYDTLGVGKAQRLILASEVAV